MDTKLSALLAAAVLLASERSGAVPPDDQPLQPETMSEKELLAKARQVTQEELELSRIAVRKADAAKVKALAQRVVARGEELDKRLTHLASAAGVTEPQRISQPMQQRLTSIEKMEGRAFDPDYLKMLLDFHQAHVLIYERLARITKDPKLRDFTREALASERVHLKEVKALAAPLVPEVQ